MECAKIDIVRWHYLFFPAIVCNLIDFAILNWKIKFADQTIYMGMALMTFASEFVCGGAIDDYDPHPRQLLGELLDGIDELDVKAM